MTDPGSLYTIVPDSWAAIRGKDAVMLHLLEGYMDAGGVTRVLTEQILDSCEHTLVAEFDADELHDYRARRPSMTFDTDHWVEADMPALLLHQVTDSAGKEFLLLAGPEPDSRWVRAVDAVLGIVADLGVSQLVSAGSIPMGVPHTRPLLVTTHGTRPGLRGQNPAFIDRVTIPGSFSALLEFRAGQRGLAARGFVAHVPHYLAQGTFAPAALRVARLMSETTGLAFPTADLEDTASATMVALSHELEGDADLSELVKGLEVTYDDLQDSGRSVPSADEIGRAMERYLAEQDDNGQEG